MPSQFDPYYFFLGIPPKERPLDNYLLLGVERFESDEQIIEMAADRQMGHLQRYESGEHGDKVAKLMSEVSRARLCLLNSNKKKVYDQQLRDKLVPQNSKPVAQPEKMPQPKSEAKATKRPPPLPKKPAEPESESEPMMAEIIPDAEASPGYPSPSQAVVDAEILPETPSRPAAPISKPAPPSRKGLTNSIGMKFVLLPAGKFVMGSPRSEPERGNNEFQHSVTIGRPFLLAVHPVTQAQYQQIMGVNPSSFSSTGLAQSEVRGIDTRNFPVEWVSWSDAIEFCRLLSELPAERSAGRRYSLPTETEWEYACRASTTTVFAFGNSLTSHQANFLGSMPYGVGLRGPNLQRPSIVGSYPPNAWGLHDMHGNVWEWCNDLYCPRHDRPLPTATKRTIRGGAWKAGARACRSASRMGESPEQRTAQIGFRVAMQAR